MNKAMQSLIYQSIQPALPVNLTDIAGNDDLVDGRDFYDRVKNRFLELSSHYLAQPVALTRTDVAANRN